MFRLNADTAPDYAHRQMTGQPATPIATQPLGGGVSNTVIRVEWDDECLVLKQPLANLDVADDWPADRTRIHNEATAARTFATALQATAGSVRVPDVRFEDTENHVIGIECAPMDATNWKRDLLEGRIDVSVGQTVGRALGTVHRHASDDEALRDGLESKRPFEQLRLDPYHRTVATRHPDVAPDIRAEIDRIRAIERTLVHGDYSPKNVLVDRAPEQAVWILDFEVAHWGDPAFDAGFMLNHLLIKALYFGDRGDDAASEACVEAAFAFWEAYRQQVPWEIEAAVVTELAVLMLARVDGKSPVEYLTEERAKNRLRRVSKQAITAEISTLDEFAKIVRMERDSR